MRSKVQASTAAVQLPQGHRRKTLGRRIAENWQLYAPLLPP